MYSEKQSKEKRPRGEQEAYTPTGREKAENPAAYDVAGEFEDGSARIARVARTLTVTAVKKVSCFELAVRAKAAKEAKAAADAAPKPAGKDDLDRERVRDWNPDTGTWVYRLPGTVTVVTRCEAMAARRALSRKQRRER